MNISLKVEGQSIQVDEILQLASDTISQVDCSVQLSTEWSDFQLVKCVWENQRVPDKYVSTLTNGTTTVPWEVLAEQGSVRVNLVGYDVSGTTVTERQTTFKIQCLNVKQKVNVTGSNAANPTAQEWQQQLASHVADTTKHITASERSAWNAKADASNVYTKAQADGKFALITAIADMATKTWVTAKGYATEAWVNAKNYATQSWVEAKGYLTEHQSLANYFTKSETNSAINSHHDSTKVDKITGKGLSTNDYTTAEKTKLSGIETGAQVNVIASDAPSDSKQYARKNGQWSEVEASGGSSVWGQITGTLADQTDLNTALGNKADKSGTYTKAQTDSAIASHHDSSKADASNVYTKTESDSRFALASAITDMATKTWVNAQGFITSLAGYATEAWVTAKNYATQSWVEAKGYLTEHQSLSAYRTSADQDVIDAGKVDKVEGKGLSTNDYTTAEKTKLGGIEANADVTDSDNVKSAGATMGVKVAGTELTKDADGKVDVPAGNDSTIGVVRTLSIGGIVSSSGTIRIQPASESEIDAKSQQYRPITPAKLDYAWKSGESANHPIKNTLDAVAVSGASYFLGTQSTVAITLPSTPSTGDMISVVFYSGATATTLTVNGSTIGTVPTPSASQRVELNFVWDSQYWAVLSNVMAVS